MAQEIERKYRVSLVNAARVLTADMVGEKFVQGYINESGMTTRVRLAGQDKAFLTLKTRAQGISRGEWEYPIPRADAEELLVQCGKRVLSKTRYHVKVGNHVWDFDVYEGAHSGLVTAEVELSSEDEAFEMPDWVGADISEDGDYTNEALARSATLPISLDS